MEVIWCQIEVKFQSEAMLAAMKITVSLPWMVWLSWLEGHSINLRVVGSISGQGTCLGRGFGPQLGTM